MHLKCLRMWQRAVLVSQPTHPDLYDMDTRQRICNVCKAEYSCHPPTRAELLATFTGPELAALIEEGCFIATSRDFSRELERQVRGFPDLMADSIVSRNWIRGAFLIVKVVEDRQREVILRVEDQEDLAGLMQQLGPSGRTIRIRDRRFSLLPNAQLRFDDATPSEAIVDMISKVPVPANFMLRPEAAGDCGEDGIVAVNLTRAFDFSSASTPLTVFRAKQRTSFRAGLNDVFGSNFAETQLEFKVTHFIGGPCEEHKVICCIVIASGGYTIIQDEDCLRKALRTAEARAGGPAAKRRQGSRGGGSESFSAGAAAAFALELQGAASEKQNEDLRRSKRRRFDPPVDEEEDTTLAESPVLLNVFWGYAGWSRCQLMGEIARGSWGLCQAETKDVVERAASEVYESVFPRLVFAPESDMSETYGTTESAEAEERRQMRRMAILHEIIRHPQRSARITLAAPDAADGQQEALVAEPAPAAPAAGHAGSTEEDGEEEEEDDMDDDLIQQMLEDNTSESDGSSGAEEELGSSGSEENE